MREGGIAARRGQIGLRLGDGRLLFADLGAHALRIRPRHVDLRLDLRGLGAIVAGVDAQQRLPALTA